MIDIENAVFTRIKLAVLEKYADAEVHSSYIAESPTFPCVEFVETDNRVHSRTSDTNHKENHVDLTYECNIYTTGDGAKQTAKAIAELISDSMEEIKFRRTFMRQIPNVDRTIYRLRLQFEGTADKGQPSEDGKIIYHIT
ncbi:MAG: hypothetical protein LUD47_06790 [Clostridia bacterium]|nr:hypothetical protein [Clostridia bacterium]